MVAAQAVAVLVAAGAAEAAGERALNAVTSWFSRRRPRSDVEQAAALAATRWSPAQLAEIHREAKLAAGSTGVAASQAEQVADKIIAGLVLPTDEDGADADEQPSDD